MDEYFALLESDDPKRRLEGLQQLDEHIDDAAIDKRKAVGKLKEMILDWDEAVREQVSVVLKKYTGR